MDPLAHLGRGLVGKGNTQNIARHDAQVVNQIGKTMGQGPGLAGTGPGNDPDVALCFGYRQLLFLIQSCQQVFHTIYRVISPVKVT